MQETSTRPDPRPDPGPAFQACGQCGHVYHRSLLYAGRGRHLWEHPAHVYAPCGHSQTWAGTLPVPHDLAVLRIAAQEEAARLAAEAARREEARAAGAAEAAHWGRPAADPTPDPAAPPAPADPEDPADPDPLLSGLALGTAVRFVFDAVPDYGGAFDGHTVTSDADPGL